MLIEEWCTADRPYPTSLVMWQENYWCDFQLPNVAGHVTGHLVMWLKPVHVLPGFYMYIETSRPRKDGDKARLLSPSFNINANSATYCFAFYYHMYGKHIGEGLSSIDWWITVFVDTILNELLSKCVDRWMDWRGLFSATGSLNVILRQKGASASETSVWSLSGNQGDRWRQAKVNIHPSTSFQVQAQPVGHWHESPHVSWPLLTFHSVFFSITPP